MADVTLKEGDRLPKLARTFTLGDDPVDLTGSTVTFNLWNAATGASVIANQSATITSAAGGAVEYAWTAGDASLPVGTYLGIFTATFSSSRVLTAPNNGVIVVEILDQTASIWSYTGNPAARTVDKVRFLSGDTDSTNQQATDAEIAWLLEEWNDDVYMAAAAVCDAAAGRASAKADESKSVGDLSISTQYGAQAQAWQSKATALRAQTSRRNPPSPNYATDAVGSFAFSVGMDRYT